MKDIKDKVMRIILATIHHKVPEEVLAMEDPELKNLMEIFLDLDLSVLGWNVNDYSDYALRVRYEYQHVPTEKFIPGRIKVLQSLGGAEHIFFTQYFRDKYEA